MGNLEEGFSQENTPEGCSETHTSSFSPYKQVSGRNGDHKWLGMTNAFILCDLIWKIQKSHAANREGNLKLGVNIKHIIWSYHLSINYFPATSFGNLVTYSNIIEIQESKTHHTCIHKHVIVTDRFTVWRCHVGPLILIVLPIKGIFRAWLRVITSHESIIPCIWMHEMNENMLCMIMKNALGMFLHELYKHLWWIGHDRI